MAGSSICSAVPCLSAGASPEDSRLRGGAVVRDGDKWWSLSDRDVPGAAEWCVGQRRFPVSELRNSDEECADGPDSEDQLAGRHVGTHKTPSWDGWDDWRCGSARLGIASLWVF